VYTWRDIRLKLSQKEKNGKKKKKKKSVKYMADVFSPTDLSKDLFKRMSAHVVNNRLLRLF